MVHPKSNLAKGTGRFKEQTGAGIGHVPTNIIAYIYNNDKYKPCQNGLDVQSLSRSSDSKRLLA